MISLKVPYSILSKRPKISLATTTPDRLFLATGRGASIDKAESDLRGAVLVALEALAKRGIDGITPLLHVPLPKGFITLKASECWAILLRCERVKAGLTQAYMAGRLGITQPSYAKLERVGYKPSLDVVLHVQAVLGVQIISQFEGGMYQVPA